MNAIESDAVTVTLSFGYTLRDREDRDEWVQRLQELFVFQKICLHVLLNAPGVACISITSTRVGIARDEGTYAGMPGSLHQRIGGGTLLIKQIGRSEVTVVISP